MENLFAYGSLKEEEVQENIFGRVLVGTPDKLIGYTKKIIEIEEEFGLTPYPIITATQNPEDSIKGVLYKLTERELQQADTYEGIHYKRIQVELQSNEIVWVYSAAI
ncbi:gamma-glutamylcyclotransferase family protein [Flavobacterium cellulosilyticum]|uniref:Gamma-glutamylcyclotransferase n=1 Tax=Flavobacterium cellulosilyticum TaxID=2541731 RepID=A0A4R5CFE9_9FLAO|nr:gamma-glutamylcyclotransferase family protein [Flavobacterium cellulosilyticum]TDD97013.1 gamma-glutamylcyclotransferase [Flavobacterium cellulosilyticum]